MHHAGQIEGTPRDFLLVDQIKLVLTNFFRAELVGRLAEVLAELVDVVGVRIDCALGEVPQLHVFGHALDIRVESSLVRRHRWLLSSVWWSEKYSIEHPAARRSPTTMPDELITQAWLTSLHRANCLGQKPPERVRPRNHGAEEIEPPHQANKASPLGEYQLARTNVARAQQEKTIRRTTHNKLNTTN